MPYTQDSDETESHLAVLPADGQFQLSISESAPSLPQGLLTSPQTSSLDHTPSRLEKACGEQSNFEPLVHKQHVNVHIQSVNYAMPDDEKPSCRSPTYQTTCFSHHGDTHLGVQY